MPKNNKDKKQRALKGQNPSVANDQLGENASHFEELYNDKDKKKKK